MQSGNAFLDAALPVDFEGLALDPLQATPQQREISPVVFTEEKAQRRFARLRIKRRIGKCSVQTHLIHH